MDATPLLRRGQDLEKIFRGDELHLVGYRQVLESTGERPHVIAGTALQSGVGIQSGWVIRDNCLVYLMLHIPWSVSTLAGQVVGNETK